MKTCFRSVAAFSTSESDATAVAGVILMPLLLYSGYTIPEADIIVVFRWISYLNVRARTRPSFCQYFHTALHLPFHSLSAMRSSL